MAGIIAALFGGRSRPVDPDPLPGVGGYALGPGPNNASGFPGSTSSTRTFAGNNPRIAKIEADTNTGWDNALGVTTVLRQGSYRGDITGASLGGPRRTPTVRTPQTIAIEKLQTNDPTEFYGGPSDKTSPGNQTAGGNPLSDAYHSVRATETPATARQPIIATDIPGAQNVRNQVNYDYLAVPGQMHTYQSAGRADQAPVNRGGQATDGSPRPDQRATPVSVPSRFVFAGGGNQTWSMLREMPYGGRGDGARGADLNGHRFYATGQQQQFMNAGQGDYGVARERGRKRPVAFTMPAPWTANFYDTTDTVGTVDQPGPTTQSPDMVYVSPNAGRASNSTGRMG